MIENVAQAIAEELGADDWRSYVSAARAAVRALREPTQDMLEAAVPGLPDWGHLIDDWYTMIDFVADQDVPA